jgi:hypothetical protein
VDGLKETLVLLCFFRKKKGDHTKTTTNRILNPGGPVAMDIRRLLGRVGAGAVSEASCWGNGAIGMDMDNRRTCTFEPSSHSRQAKKMIDDVFFFLTPRNQFERCFCLLL